ncbi:type I restriction endonuclease subunit R [[Ruminococcus] torques]|uniref:type I restriction endonuclease subunit R n=2 Tax=Bacillota TaxID=1239 RepID=UPI001D077065|nr:type I restriction endonuclease subunit R [[Ruminococcus] torques]MCB7250504.1 type I restriction endonuclease subunit R [[Ruminococcus] torques]MCG4856143.1 type I restriction endonuclease subunit R [[Ruminococcus] torques]MCG5029034.1 type I restriction endonuclease subunit R [[Ruminococcus] torques]MCQ5336152.1 type I restriction endonuclease subunit R [[Ruminococcus] torques]MCQ5348324.1 type I restriction endonuclease subunit R [[Ruminococcus] torques]
MLVFNEASYENSIIELFENMGYTHAYGPDVNTDHHNPLRADELRSSIERINPKLPAVAIDEAIHKLTSYEAGSLVSKNEIFMDYLQNGIEVSYHIDGENRAALVYLVDYDNVNMNSFVIANQWTFEEFETKRPDIVIFLNGIPVVVMELKSPKANSATVEDAYLQIRNYMKSIESFFIYNAFCVISDQSLTKAGTITASFDRFMEWKTVDGDYEETRYADFTTLMRGMFSKTRFLDIIHNFICFSKESGGDAKILAAYHQYFAVKKAVESTAKASGEGGDGRGGVFWHTQGSGKSLSMIFYAKQLQNALNSPTIVVVTDRNDLDDQLFAQFSKCKDFLRQTPVQAEKRKLSDDEIKNGSKIIGLKDWLDGREANGIIFTTMQKFEETDEPLNNRKNIVVMADEAHRSQYGFEERVNAKTGKITIGNARRVRDALPNATYIGFTGTPIELEDRNTLEVFGNYIDIYDMTQAVADGATRPIYYESRVIKLNLDETTLQKIDALYDSIKQDASEVDIEKSKHDLAKMDGVLGAPDVVDSLCRDIIDHYENYRQYEQTGKAMIVAYSRPMAIKIYEKILSLREDWKNKVKIVMTGGNQDPEEWKALTGNKAYREGLAREFKDNNSEFKIAIVIDMWLTGFDVPSMSTMYIFKPMKGHNLMQAIARVNRVFKTKEGGLIVDYIGIASALKAAMRQYTDQDRKNFGEMDIAKTAYKKFQEKLIVCRDLMHGFDYTEFMTTESDLTRASLITGGVNFLSDPHREEIKEDFITEAYLMRQSFSLCKSIATAEERREEAYIETVRSVLVKIVRPGPLSLKDINAQVNELLKQSVQSGGIINLFTDVDKEFNLFNSAFMQEIAKMPEKNLSIELLKKLIAEQVRIYKRTNVVKSQRFSEMLDRIVKSYLNGMLTNEEVIDELMKMAHDIAAAHENGNSMGLSDEELAFYDALTKPAAVKDFYSNDQLIAITKELTEELRRSRTVDWEKKESARAGMRRMVKRLLKRYKYPPEGMEDALQTVISQCEMWTDN